MRHIYKNNIDCQNLQLSFENLKVMKISYEYKMK